MENFEVEEKKKTNKKVLRLLLGVSLVVVSLATGLVSGIHISKLTSTSQNGNGAIENQHTNELIQVLKNNWLYVDFL